MELTAANGDRIQLSGPGHRYFEFYRSHGDSTGPATGGGRPGSDKAELARSGAELIGEPESDGTWTWLHLPGARPNIHTLGARMA